MTVKELIKRLLDLPVPMDKATVTFYHGKLSITVISSDEDSGVYLIEPTESELREEFVEGITRHMR